MSFRFHPKTSKFNCNIPFIATDATTIPSLKAFFRAFDFFIHPNARPQNAICDFVNTTHPDYLSDDHLIIWVQHIDEGFQGLKQGNSVFQLSGGSLDAYDAAGGKVPSKIVGPSENSTKSSKGKERATPIVPLTTTPVVAAPDHPKGKKAKGPGKASKRAIENGKAPVPTQPQPSTTLRNKKEIPYVPMGDEQVEKLQEEDDNRVSDDSSGNEMDIDDDDEPLTMVYHSKPSRKRAVNPKDDEAIVVSSDDMEIINVIVQNPPPENSNANNAISIEDLPPTDDVELNVPIGQGGGLDSWALIHPTVYGGNLHVNPNAKLSAEAVSDNSIQRWDVR